METKKSAIEISSLFQLFKLPEKSLPQVFTYVGDDSYEFEIAVEFFKTKLERQGQSLDIIVIVAEGGEQAKLFAELFTPDMFFPRKLIILKNANAFFKPILEAKANSDYSDYVSGFKKNIVSLSENINLLIHYEGRDLPASFASLFQNQYSFYKPKTLYQNDIAKALKEVLEQENVKLDEDAWDEFIHKSPANIGSYIKGIRKLKQYLNKSKFTLSDINEILFTQTEMNANTLVESLIQTKKTEFYKEFTKFSDDNGEILSFLSRLLNKLDEIRKIRIIRAKHNGEIPIPIMDEILKTGSYSEARKGFMRRQLTNDAKFFTDKSLNQFYEILIEMNIKYKSGLRNEEARVYFIQRTMEMFKLLHSVASSS
ncbi:MAG: DNA polymerase III subunit delta [Leptospira sp.]|jgi:DNA polymerase-3 subunit delta|nr:DNA polymerase III subunit delta [Leptospira sp.]